MTLILHSRESVSQTLRDSGSPRVSPFFDFDIYDNSNRQSSFRLSEKEHTDNDSVLDSRDERNL
jgi:hypothetical protein